MAALLVPLDAWPAIAGVLGKPWPPEAVAVDMAWHLATGTRIPGRPSLVRRWGWTQHAVEAVRRGENASMNIESTADRQLVDSSSTAGQRVDAKSSAGFDSPSTARRQLVDSGALPLLPLPSPPPPSPPLSPPGPPSYSSPPSTSLSPHPPPQPSSRSKAEKSKKPSTWEASTIRALSDTWASCWDKSRRGPYPWQLQGRDRHLLLGLAEAVGIQKGAGPTEDELARVRSAFVRYLAACDAGTVWPPEAPNLGAFSLKTAAWLQPTPKAKARDVYEDVPRVSALPPEEADAIRADLDATWRP